MKQTTHRQEEAIIAANPELFLIAKTRNRPIHIRLMRKALLPVFALLVALSSVWAQPLVNVETVLVSRNT